MKTIRLACMSLGLLILLTCSCKKTLDKEKENYLLGVLTEGTWFLQNYSENELDYTYFFSAFTFKFYDNGTVDARTTTETVSGTWVGDINNLTFTVNFPASNIQLAKLNHVWQWTRSNIGLIFAEHVTSSQKKTIRLQKQ